MRDNNLRRSYDPQSCKQGDYSTHVSQRSSYKEITIKLINYYNYKNKWTTTCTSPSARMLHLIETISRLQDFDKLFLKDKKSHVLSGVKSEHLSRLII